MTHSLTSRDLEVAGAVEDEIALPAVSGRWSSLEPGLSDERHRQLDLLIAVGRLGDRRPEVTLSDSEALLRQALNGMGRTLSWRAVAGDEAAQADLEDAVSMCRRLPV